MEKRLLSVNELAERWGKTPSTIRSYVADGIITPCKGIPGTVFNIEYISSLEGVEHNLMSPWERRRLEKEIRELEYKYNSLKSVLANILTESSKVINL